MSQMETIKSLRERTGAGIVDVKKALDEAAGDEVKAIDILRKRGQDKALKKGDRDTHEGVVVSYVHGNSRVGVLLKLYCETDFVARNDEFKALAYDIAMHIAALAPTCVKPEDVSGEALAHEQAIWKEQLATEGKPADIMEKILAGKEKKFREEAALLSQSFVKEPEKTVGALITEKIHKIGENIQVGSFVRYEI
jgi:elongation factor Ts